MSFPAALVGAARLWSGLTRILVMMIMVLLLRDSAFPGYPVMARRGGVPMLSATTNKSSCASARWAWATFILGGRGFPVFPTHRHFIVIRLRIQLEEIKIHIAGFFLFLVKNNKIWKWTMPGQYVSCLGLAGLTFFTTLWYKPHVAQSGPDILLWTFLLKCSLAMKCYSIYRAWPYVLVEKWQWQFPTRFWCYIIYRPGNNSSPTGILVFRSKNYWKTCKQIFPFPKISPLLIRNSLYTGTLVHLACNTVGNPTAN